MIRISTGLGVDDCIVQTADGRLIHGARVPDDYARTWDGEGVFDGRPVHVVDRDRKSGNEVFVDGVQRSEMVGGTLKWSTSDDLVTEVSDAEPPPLRPPVRRRAS